MNEKLIAALRNDAESANADYSTPLTPGNHLDADALEAADAKMHEQDLRIADLVAHLNADQAKVARLVRENEELKRRLDENIGASKLWNQKYYNLAAEKLDTTYAHICDLLATEKPGRLVVPPFDIGTIVYSSKPFIDGIVREGEVVCFEVYEKNQYCFMVSFRGEAMCAEYLSSEIGKTVFLTRESVESALGGGSDE